MGLIFKSVGDSECFFYVFIDFVIFFIGIHDCFAIATSVSSFQLFDFCCCVLDINSDTAYLHSNQYFYIDKEILWF